MMDTKEEDRLITLSATDRELWAKGLLVAGMDEVGRGPLAGPVTVCCLIMPAERLIPYINDSKKLSEKRRNALFDLIIEDAIGYSLASVGPEEIDSVNILQATKNAMRSAAIALQPKPDIVLIDAVKLDLPFQTKSLIHGDALSYSIAASSIVAKVTRDRYMAQMDELYPEYGFARNKGFGTKEHIEALRKYGPSPIHRKTFISNFV